MIVDVCEGGGGSGVDAAGLSQERAVVSQEQARAGFQQFSWGVGSVSACGRLGRDDITEVE